LNGKSALVNRDYKKSSKEFNFHVKVELILAIIQVESFITKSSSTFWFIFRVHVELLFDIFPTKKELN
jgi:hypothetical protein